MKIPDYYLNISENISNILLTNTATIIFHQLTTSLPNPNQRGILILKLSTPFHCKGINVTHVALFEFNECCHYLNLFIYNPEIDLANTYCEGRYVLEVREFPLTNEWFLGSKNIIRLQEAISQFKCSKDYEIIPAQV